MLRNIYYLAQKELLHLVRDRRTLAFLILVPSVLTVIFGFAIGNPRVTGIRTRVVDLDGGRIAAEYVDAMDFSATFRPEVRSTATPDDVKQAEADLLADRINAIVILPAGLTEAVTTGKTAQVRVVVDASDTFAAPSVLRELGTTTVQQNTFLAADSMRRQDKSLGLDRSLELAAPIELKPDLRFNPELKSQNFVMPGVIGLILQIMTVIVMATSIARERERGTMEQLSVTPLTPAQIFIGKLLPYFFLALLDTANVLLLARVLFGVSLAGHYGVVIALLVAFILGSLGVGQLISVVSKNQSQAIQLAIAFILPAFVLSGAFTPIETQPERVRSIAYIFPLTYFCRSFRAALLRQATFADVRLDLVVMGSFVLLTFGVSVVLLRLRPETR